MRSVTKKIMSAFIAGKSAKSKNTWTNGKSVWLHGNEIIRREDNGDIVISNCGWNTPTTKERLNGFFHIANLPYYIYQQNYIWYICNSGSGQERLQFGKPNYYFTLRELHDHFNVRGQ